MLLVLHGWIRGIVSSHRKEDLVMRWRMVGILACGGRVVEVLSGCLGSFVLAFLVVGDGGSGGKVVRAWRRVGLREVKGRHVRRRRPKAAKREVTRREGWLGR